ncbi:hypothetical protein GCM10010271_24900 [Streptomyces kurssanovii]|nr:hypothetical protein GCM10010271_24900 [Streptomyces kurssanovii]
MQRAARSKTVRMTHTTALADSPAPTGSTVRSPRRLRLSIVVTVVAATLALTACGSERPGADGSRSNPAVAVGARATESPAAPQPQVAFAEMLETVAQPCSAETPSSGEESVAPAETPTTGPAKTPRTGPAKTPWQDGDDPAAPTTGPGVDMSAAEWCAGHLHVERVTHALMGLADPTPAKVRKVLNGLGYIDERIHGLEQAGPATRFFVDLRVTGGSLCLKGSAAGESTDIEFFGASGTGPFTSVKRKQ